MAVPISMSHCISIDRLLVLLAQARLSFRTQNVLPPAPPPLRRRVALFPRSRVLSRRLEGPFPLQHMRRLSRWCDAHSIHTLKPSAVSVLLFPLHVRDGYCACVRGASKSDCSGGTGRTVSGCCVRPIRLKPVPLRLCSSFPVR